MLAHVTWSICLLTVTVTLLIAWATLAFKLLADVLEGRNNIIFAYLKEFKE